MHQSPKKVTWLDLCAFPIYFLIQIFLPLILVGVLLITHQSLSEGILIMFVSVITSIAVIAFLILTHRRGFMLHYRHALSDIRRHIKLILLTYIGYFVTNAAFMALMTQLPAKWQFEETGNQDALMIFFEDPKWLPLMFIGIVLLTPATEELLFRHVLIGELGKKFGIVFMSIISVVVFALLHMQVAQSPLEIVPYLLMGAMFVIVYVKSGCNIAVSIAMHVFNNFIAFIAILFQM